MSTISPVAETTSPEITLARRSSPWRWGALLLVGLGIACYFITYVWLAAPDVLPATPMFMASMFGPVLCALLLVAGWLALSRESWLLRLAVLGVGALLGAAAVFGADPSARFFLITWGIPPTLAIVAIFLCFAGALPPQPRWLLALFLAMLVLGPWEFIQCSEGTTANFGMEPHWRWRPSADRQAAQFDETHKADAPAAAVPAVAGASDWPAFRGPRQDSVIADIKLGDWQTPPTELWRRPIGPGWSSVCVVKDRLFTQEQRDDKELVTCYRTANGTQIWACGDETRYSDAPSGAGPRGTPTFHNGKVYTFGATGILNCINADSGERIWRVDLKETLGATQAPFGFASSPVVVNDQVLVQPGALAGPRLVAYHAGTGQLLWQAGGAAVGYSSPHLARLGGVQQVLIYNGDGLYSHDATTGKELWSYEFKAEQTAPVCVQPLLLRDDRIVLGAGAPGSKSRCVKPTRQGDSWSVEEVWQSPFYPRFNDCVVRGDCIYGLEAGRLVCLDMNTGKRRWKDGNYGNGQILLAGDRLLIIAESGRLALVNPMPDGWQELRVLPALSDKTWNHPVITNGRLFVRNAREMVCYQLNP
jgi:outer membrane protein assembly factor BamB